MIFFEKIEQKKMYLFLILMIIFVFSSLYACFFVKKEYLVSTTLMLVKLDEKSNTNGNIELTDNLFETLKELIENKEKLLKVKEDLRLNSFDEKNISVLRISNSDTFKIIIKNLNADEALSINDKIVDMFKNSVEEIYKDTTIYKISDSAIVDTTYGGRIAAVYMCGLLLFILITLIYITLLINYEKKIKSLNDIEDEISLKGLVEVPTFSKNKKYINKGINNEKLVISNVFKTLRSNIQFLNVNNKGKNIILVTSSNPKEGKSFIASNIAISFAEVGKKVIIIDGDMKTGRLAKIFNIPNNLGFSNFLSGLDNNGIENNQLINKYINETEIKNLNLITSGTVPPNPSELLASEKLNELIKDLTVFYDVVVIDGNSVLVSTDSLILSRVATSTILVSNYKTKRDDLWKTKRDIQNVGGRIIGVILNKVKNKEKIIIEIKNEKLTEENKNNNKKANHKNGRISIVCVSLLNTLKKIFNSIFNNKENKILALPINENNKSIEKFDNKIPNETIVINHSTVSDSNKSIIVKKEDILNNNNNKENDIKKNNKERSIKDNIKFSDFVKKDTFDTISLKNKIINNHEENNEELRPVDNNFELISKYSEENVIEEPIKIPKKLMKEKCNDFIDILKNIVQNANNVFSNSICFIKDKLNNVIALSKETVNKINVIVNTKLKKEIKIETSSENIIDTSNKIILDKKLENSTENIAKENDIPMNNNDINEISKDYIQVNTSLKNDKYNDINNENLINELSDDGVLVIVDAENAYCRAFSKISFIEKLVRGIDRIDGLPKASYSSNEIKKVYREISEKYQIPKDRLKRVDSLIYKTLCEYDESIWIERKVLSHKSEDYFMVMSKEYEKLPKENNNQYITRCQRNRKNELLKKDLFIEYKLENIFSTNKMNITDKIIMKKYANYFEIDSKLKNKTEIEQSKFIVDTYNSILKAISKLKKNSVDTSKELSEKEKIARDAQEKIRIKEKKKKIAEEKRRIRKEKKEIQRIKKAEEKNKKQQKLKLIKEEEKEKARIEEELLGDNLYPKTKNNKLL